MIFDWLLGRKHKKIAVILHGYPSPIQEDMPIWKLLKENGYEVLMPRYLESRETFSINGVVKESEKLLKGRKPDLLIGFSLGGMILPYVAAKYPKAKVIFAATGSRLKPKMQWMEWAIKMAAGKTGTKAAKWLVRIPVKAMSLGYDMVRWQKGPTDKVLTEKDKQLLIKTFKSTDPVKHIEIAKFARTADTRNLLKKLDNKSLVCVGSRDDLMPPEVGEELAGLVKNSQIVRIDAEHFDVLNDQAMTEIQKFIRE